MLIPKVPLSLPFGDMPVANFCDATQKLPLLRRKGTHYFPSLKKKGQGRFFQPNADPSQVEPYSFDDLSRPRQHFDWNRMTDLFCRPKVNNEFKLRCLLHRQISRFGTFQDLVHVNSRAPKEVSVVHSIGHEAALIDKLLLVVNSRQPVSDGKLDDPLSLGEKARIASRHNRAHLPLLRGLKGALYTFGVRFSVDLL
jgi:hypothetical protein